jgi:hypothetical protein
VDLKTSVIVPLAVDSSPIDALVRSVDEQSLKYEEFEVLFADCGASPAAVKRLHRLVECRPNMHIVETRSSSAGAALADCLQQARGEYVLFLSPDDQPYPSALEKIHGFGHAHQVDIVIGRRSLGGAQALPVGLLRNDPRFGSDPDPSLSVPSYRREYVSRLDVQVSGSSLEEALSQLRVAAMEATEAVGVLTDYPCLQSRDDARTGGSGRPVVLALHKPSLQWHENALHVTVRGDIRPATPVADPLAVSDTIAAVVLRHGRSGVERLVPVESKVVDASNGIVEYSYQISLKSPQDEPLGPGQWTMELHTGGPGLACAATVPSGGRHLAVMDGNLFSCAGSAGRLVLEVGSPRQSIGPIRPRNVRVHESAQGTRLSASLPAVFAQGIESVQGSISLGQLVIPAKIVVRDGQARLEAFVSGLAGTYALSTQFGRGGPSPTGLELVVTGTGEMSVRRRAKRKRAATPDRRAGRGPKAVRDTAGPNALHALRRRVPSKFEPAVRTLARRSMVRRVYQRVGGRLHRDR